MEIKMIMFDLDGTLADSGMDIRNAINYAIEGSGVGPLSLGEAKEFIGQGVTRLFSDLKARYPVDLQVEELVSRFSEHYAEHLLDNTTLYPGVADTLAALGPCRKAVVTNKRERSSARILEALGIAKHFDIVVGSDTASERKPSPEPLFFALARFGIDPGESVIVGDSPYDIEAGLAAGVTTVAVTYGYRPVRELRKAHFLIGGFSDLPGIIERL
jgi:phosphoglycolate phosphatase